ncbi:Ion-translocating oxidoreductase complex subunitA [Candidatus Erwinia haradaeae]|uniref:Ion-translocating oxidoreductase complex subunit A n=1 Tax=Candidatus Erwinia haradaeae TaxID=1922217 RepID=A0A451CYI0_9GAMM|nr:electron transport complex subunit RsxA [Candidatus Erwinia haradaeae]VFP78398.1 Ion-translocating oxidoreductase complex subunitA [Candidatus Erwinia haradaeae]
MTKYLLIFSSTVLMNNFVLVKFLGLCPFMGVSKKLEAAIGMGLATTFVITLSSMLSWIVNYLILTPLHLHYLRTITYILLIASVVQFTELMVHKTSPNLYRVLGIFLPLITTNCSVLGVPLLSMNLRYNFIESAIYGFSGSISFLLIIVLFAGMREHLVCADVPEPFKGSSIILITAGLMAVSFMGFTGLVKS